MKKFKYWFLSRLIKMCEVYLTFSETAQAQGEINVLVSLKKSLIRRRDELNT